MRNRMKKIKEFLLVQELKGSVAMSHLMLPEAS